MTKKLLRTADIRDAILHRDAHSVVRESFIAHTKWELRFEAILKLEGRFYAVPFVRSATREPIDPFHGSAYIEAAEVEPFECTYVDYREVRHSQSLAGISAEASIYENDGCKDCQYGSLRDTISCPGCGAVQRV